jgi:integrin beta 3
MDLQEAFDRGFETVKSYIDAEIAVLKSQLPIPGPQGPPGDKGDVGARGEKGDTGRDGRDAADLAALRSYVAEKIAEEIGGLCEKMTITSPDNGRTISFEFGNWVHDIKTAIPLDVGVWVERSYIAGDAVSHGGSLFIAQKSTTAKPGKSDDWRLAVKRGSDGRDHRADERRQAEPVRFK